MLVVGCPMNGIEAETLVFSWTESNGVSVPRPGILAKRDGSSAVDGEFRQVRITAFASTNAEL